jgi:putative membrane protein
MMMGFGLIWVLLIIGVIAYLIGWRPNTFEGRQTTSGGQMRAQPEDALEILNQRYASGEISQEEYREMRRDLER